MGPAHRLEKQASEFQLLDPLRGEAFTKACADDNGQVGTKLPDFFGKDIPRHFRHGHIRNDQINIVRVFPDKLEGLEAAFLGSHSVA